MNHTLTKAEIEDAYLFWRTQYPEFAADKLIQPFLMFKIPETPSLKQVRKARLLSMQQLADRVGVSKASYRDMEDREPSGDILISTLQKIAEAMDCELIYAMRSKKKKSFSRMIWELILPDVISDRRLIQIGSSKRIHILARLAADKLTHPHFRKKNGLIRNKIRSPHPVPR